MLQDDFFTLSEATVKSLVRMRFISAWNAKMKTTIILSLLLALAVAVTVQIGCGATPAAQPDKTAAAAQTEKAVETEATQLPAPLPKSSQAGSVQPTVDALAKDESQMEVVEVGYKKGMHIPEFGMSLLDGTRVTSAKLVEEGKPTFIYFHATW